MNQVQYQLQKMFKKVNPNFVYVAGAILLAGMIWASPILFLRDSILGKVAMVASIIALTLYHRIAGIIALTVIIAIMQTQSKNKVIEKLTMNMDAIKTESPLIATSPSPTSSSIQFASSDEFREKYCMKGVGGAGTAPPSLQYMLSPALFDESTGKPQFKTELIKQLNIPSFNASNSCKPDPSNSSNYLSIANMCDPECKWTTNTPAGSAAATPAPLIPKKEGFATMVKNSSVQNVKNYVKDSMNTMKETANTLQRKIL